MFEQFAEENHHPFFNFQQVYRAWRDCRANKRNKLSALAFEVDLEQNLVDLTEELLERRYRPSASICFYTEKPKCREIFAADFRDRVVHHLIYNHISPIWEKTFIFHSFACRPEKGAHLAVDQLQKMQRRVTHGGRKRAFYLKLDIRNFFMTIDRRLLFEMLAQKHHRPDLRWLLETVIFHDCTQDYEMKDRENLRFRLPPHKSLFHARPDCGLPIGNLTSQFFANVYLNALDQFVKHDLKCRFYLRYVDDLVLLHCDAVKLRTWQEEIRRFLAEKLRLKLNPKATKLGLVTGGVDFGGFVVRPNYCLVRRRTVGNLKTKLKIFRVRNVQLRRSFTMYRFDSEEIDALTAAINAYLGHFQHADCDNLLQKLWQKHAFLQRYFSISNKKVKRFDAGLRKQPTLKRQVSWLGWKYGNYARLIQIGNYYEVLGKQAVELAPALDVNVIKGWRGYRHACGFPAKLLPRMVKKLEHAKIPVLAVRQTGRECLYAKERLPYMIIDGYEESFNGRTL